MPSTISVQMTVYNTAWYLPEAVESIFNQTFGEIELIIIDDGSTDGSGELLERYATEDRRIRLILRENRGICASRNEALSLATGEFLAIMDSDDEALSDRFEVQVAFLRLHPEIICLGSAIMEIDDAGRDLLLHRFPPDDATIQERLLKDLSQFANPGVMMRREVVLAVGGYREEDSPAEDLDLSLRLGERGRLANLEDVLLRYRIHPESIISRQHDTLNYLAKMASDQACDRRGIARQFEPLPPYRQRDGRTSKHEYSVKYGWWGFMRGDRRTVLHYALQAVRCMPLRRSGWHLLACTVLKPIRRGRDAAHRLDCGRGYHPRLDNSPGLHRFLLLPSGDRNPMIPVGPIHDGDDVRLPEPHGTWPSGRFLSRPIKDGMVPEALRWISLHVPDIRTDVSPLF